MSRLRTLWNRWAWLWDLEEHPRSLALLRMALALVLLWDLSWWGLLGLVEPILGPTELGGLTDVTVRETPPLIYRLLGPQMSTAWVVWGGALLSTITLLCGFFTRTSALALLFFSAQLAFIAPGSDRGIDMLMRNIFLILALSGSGRVWSVDAWRAGQLDHPEVRIPAWPRLLIIVQITVMYFTAGVQKVGYVWTPMGGFSALYVILQDPGFAAHDFRWVAAQPWLFVTQVGTAVTVVWQWLFPVVLLLVWYELTPDRPGRLRHWTNRYHLHLPWLLVGIIFHVGLILTMNLGIFPFAMLATYLAFVHPAELGQVHARLHRWRLARV